MPLHPEKAGAVQRVLGVAQEWRLQLDGADHRIVLGNAPRRFLVDGVEHTFGRAIQRGPRTATFDLGEHEASMTWSNQTPSIGANFLRPWRKGRNLGRRTMLVTIVAGAVAGPGGSAAAATSAMALGWAIYQLRVDGKSRGSWVRGLGGGNAFEGWVFVRPDEELPDPDWVDWPALPAPSAGELASNRRAGMLLKITMLAIIVLVVLGVLFLPGGLLNVRPA